MHCRSNLINIPNYKGFQKVYKFMSCYGLQANTNATRGKLRCFTLLF